MSPLLIGALLNVITDWVIQFKNGVAIQDLLFGPAVNALLVVFTLRYRRAVWILVALALLHLPGRGPEWQERSIVFVFTVAAVTMFLAWGRGRRNDNPRAVTIGRRAWARRSGFPFDHPLHRDITLFWPSVAWLCFNVGLYVWQYHHLIDQGKRASIYGAVIGCLLVTLLPIYAFASLRRAVRSRESR